MDVIFLGTGAGTPSRQRNVSSLALRRDDGEVWLFDCGEGTQHQLLRSSIKPKAITRLFITHLHGDHCYGVFGLLACLGIHGRDGKPLHIIAPKGLQAMIECVLRLSAARPNYPVHIHELHPSGEDLMAGGWQVHARPLCHRVPCFGYVLVEPDGPGVMDADALERLNIPHGPWRGTLARGIPATLPDGRSIDPASVVGPPRPGRRITILGDTSDSAAITDAAQNSDILVHEATFEQGEEARARTWGHSTTSMAGSFAHSIHARHLILSHVSCRYEQHDIDQFITQAAQECPQCQVHLAADFRAFHLRRASAPGIAATWQWSNDHQESEQQS
ncbi:MAG: ribonuclease Z [Planctomycetota bacterium]|nr:MAG: ribonuclease Z [Planctomycetota bacterium]